MAVVPIPIKGCTKTVIVLPTDTGCADFAAKNGCTFQDLLKWNLKLRTDCANLDVNAPLCVSVTPGAGNGTAPVLPTSAPVATGTGVHTTATILPKPAATTTSAAAPVSTTAPKIGSAVAPNSAVSTKSSFVVAAADY
ncbi:hypothetical protein EDD11_007670 [Mortierella claussenii]|nr:hypothetical protein EDD11_007670 [Mortierella claussenii]